MANAKKCDRCGEYFDFNNYIMVPLETDPDYNNSKKKLVITVDRPYDSDIFVDLCPKCVEEFTIWWSHICRDKLVENPRAKENGNV